MANKIYMRKVNESMKNLKVTQKLMVSVSKLIKGMAVFSANSSSAMGFCQPAEPKEMKKFKK